MERKIWMILLVLLLGILGFWLMPKTPKDNMEDIFLPQSIQAQTVAPTENSAISLPYAPERWELVAEELICYNGPYIEDGTNAPVSDVAGLILHNAGDRGISFAVLALEQGDRTTYFTVTWLPPGQRVLVLAMQRGTYIDQPITDCRVLGIRWDDFHSAPVTAQIFPEGGLEVTNLTGLYQEEVCLRFKLYRQEEGMYFGGITQCVKVPVLTPWEISYLCPEDFDSETVRLVAKVK